MAWLVWRQHRAHFLVTVSLIFLLGVVFTVNAWAGRVWIIDNVPPGCPGPGEKCAAFIDRLAELRGQVGSIIVFTPFACAALMGMLWGAPLVARELENGTGQLAWTQSVPRRKWLATQSYWILGMAVATGLILSVMVSLWSQAYAGWGLDDPPLQPFAFDARGLNPAGWCLFAVALGIAAGLVTRRPLVAMGIVIASLVVLMSVAHTLRPHYAPPARLVTSDVNAVLREGGLPLRRTWLDPTGQESRSVDPGACPAPQNQDRNLIRIQEEECLLQRGYQFVYYFQPVERWWLFQGLEFVALTGISMTLVGFAIWRIRDANV